jgi:capsular exopolysaccharide synthesis family protein
VAKKKISPINEEFDFKLFVTIAKKNMLWFAFLMLLSVVIALVILRYSAPVFECTSVIKIANEDNAQNVLGLDSKNGFYNDNNSEIAGDIELIKSKIIIGKAVRNLPLQVSYYSKGSILVNELYKQTPFTVDYTLKDSSILGNPILVEFKNKNTLTLTYTSRKSGKKSSQDYYVGKWINLPEATIKINVLDYNDIVEMQKDINKDVFFFTINNETEVVSKIAKELAVSVLNIEAKTIQIKLKDKNAIKASDIVNKLAQEFNIYDVEKNSEVANKILDFIDKTISSIDIELSDSENSIEAFKRTNKIISPDQAITDVTTDYKNYQNQLLLINTQLSLYQSLSNDIKGNNDIGKFLLSISGTAKDAQFLTQLTKLQQLIDERDQIRLQATENAEVSKSINTRIQNQKEIIFKSINNEVTTLQNQKQYLSSLLSETNSRFVKIPNQQAEFSRLERLFNVNEKFYSLLLDKKAEFSITRAGYVPKHVILVESNPNTPPVSPNRALIISACLMIGFLISFIIIFTRYLLHNEINSLEEIGQYTEASLLGIVPKYKREIPVSQLLVDKNPKSVISEAFRSIRTNLQFISNEDEPKILAVTSTISGEGKTFNAINLAGVVAFSGKKVIILDLDMRKPKIHIGFNVENEKGMSTLLIGKDTIDNCIVHSSLANLDFITAGPIPPNPAELIINPRMNEILAYLKTKYDIIIADLPPVGIVSDGVPILQIADYPLYILRTSYSKKMFIAQLNKLMNENKISNMSVILNGVEMSRLKYGYGYGYSYGYGYGYGYSYGYGYYEEDDEPNGFIDKLRKLISKKR